MTILQEILNRNQKLADMQLAQKSARTWFMNEAKKIEYVDPVKLLESKEMKARYRPLPGYMYTFWYDAKHKATLPYWDKFPLIFPFSYTSKGFTAINLHYIQPEHRVKLMDALYGLAFTNKYSEEVRLRLSYDILTSSAKYKYFKPCVKQYLYSQVKSRFLLIDWKEWPIALMLPTARFNAPLSSVYADSNKMVKTKQTKTKGV